MPLKQPANISELYQHSLLPELLDFIGPERAEDFLAIFGGVSLRIPSPAEIATRQNELHIARAVERYHAGEIDAEALQAEAKRRGIQPWMRIFHVARRVKGTRATTGLTTLSMDAATSRPCQLQAGR